MSAVLNLLRGIGELFITIFGEDVGPIVLVLVIVAALIAGVVFLVQVGRAT